MALDFPNNPSVGQEFTGGGFTWVWSGTTWNKLAASPAGGNGFTLFVGASGNTTYTFDEAQPAGDYVITSKLNDTTYDVYFVTSADAPAGYTNGVAIEATAAFNRVVVYGATSNDVLTFEAKPSASPAASGNVADGAAPFLTSATPATLAAIDSTTTVTGGNFATDVQIVFTGQDAVNRPAKNIVRTSSTQLIVTRPDSFPVAQEPYTMTATNAGITNPSTNVNRLTNYFDAGGGITWVTTSPLPGYTVNSAYTTTLQATDADGGAVTFAITTGSLPTGLSLNSTTGVISGTPPVAQESTFTVTATDSGGNIATRQFSLAVFTTVTGGTTVTSGGFVYHTFTSTSNLVISGFGKNVEILAIAGGGAGGSGGGNGGGGGAGGVKTYSGFLGAGTYTATIGAGGTGSNSSGSGNTTKGQNTTFGALVTANGGGRGQDWVINNASPSTKDGGSGGGGWGNVGVGTGNGAGFGISGEGFNGGQGASGGAYAEGTGGGGGASEVGLNAGYIANSSGRGGNGTSNFSAWGVATNTGQNVSGTRWYAGGGGGGSPASSSSGWTIAGVGGNGGGGAGGPVNNQSLVAATSGTANTGGGGGGGSYRNDGGTANAGFSGNGGSGIVIVRYAA